MGDGATAILRRAVPPAERGALGGAVDAGLAALALTIALRNLAEPDRTAPARLVLVAVDALAAVLFLARTRASAPTPPSAVVAALPSAVLGGVAFALAPSPSAWSAVSSAVFAVGGVLTAVSLAFLGRSFAVLPAVRELRSSGPYAVVRHPAYAGELVLVAGACLARADAVAVGLLALAIATTVVRLRVEERLLGDVHGSYADYARRVRWRLIPFVY